MDTFPENLKYKVFVKFSPFRDWIWVEKIIQYYPAVPLGTGYNLGEMMIKSYCVPKGTLIPVIHLFSTDILSLKGQCFNKHQTPTLMLKFFRKIRQKLLAENRVTRYLVYAIGEIFLVVIGILIALQINNWNEERKQNHSIRLTIQSLIEDFKQDTIQLKLDIKTIEEDLERLGGFKDRLSQPTSTIDTLRHIARYEYIPFFDPSNEMNRNTIVSILNTGIIEYFDHGLKAKILKFNSDQLKSIKIMDENVSIYLNTQYSFGLGIASQSGNPNSMLASVTIDGPLSEQYWSTIDDKQLLQSMLNTISGKMAMNKILFLTKKDLFYNTTEILSYLQKINL